MSRGGITYRTAAPSPEMAERVFRLYESVHGHVERLAARWEWEFLRHPRRLDIRLHYAEADGVLVGLTVRHPIRVAYRGEVLNAAFASNSMVAPGWRGRGIIRKLYSMAMEEPVLHLSKGTAPEMYAILRKIGYREIQPATFQQCYVRPLRLLLQRAGWKAPHAASSRFKQISSDEMTASETIPDDAGCIRGIDGPIKDASHLRWRYVDIPHRKYSLFVRRDGGRLVSLLVMREAGPTIYIVDLIWEKGILGEPRQSLAFAASAARRMGASKIVAWFTSSEIRQSLRNLGFVNRGETPRFSYASAPQSPDIEWQSTNFVHGDGDIDYL